jgi:hypothetical protein
MRSARDERQVLLLEMRKQSDPRVIGNLPGVSKQIKEVNRPTDREQDAKRQRQHGCPFSRIETEGDF